MILKDKNSGGSMPETVLPVVEQFYSIQGEGFNAGTAAYFIRLAGCNVRCEWCDAKYTWGMSGHAESGVCELVRNVSEAGANAVVITGGEPLLHDLSDLCSALHELGVRIMLETSGTMPLRGDFDWICVSPKRKLRPLNEVLREADELKAVISRDDDFSFAEENASHVSGKCVLSLQPEWSRMDAVMPGIVEYVKRNPAWRVSLQTHKFMNVP